MDEFTSTKVGMEKLKGTINYRDWAFQMQNILVFEDLWQCVTGKCDTKGESADKLARREEKARARLCLSVDKSCYPHIVQAKTAKDVWDALRKAYDDTGLHRRLSCLRTLCSIKLDKFDSMEMYVNEILSLAEQLSSMNKPLDDEFLAAIMLQGLPQEYEPMIMALEHSSMDITTDMVKTKLLQDKRWKGSAGCSDDCLFTRNRGNDRTSSRGEKKKASSTSKNTNTSSNTNKLWCWKCHTQGHVKKDCTSLDKRTTSTSMVLSALTTDSSWIIDSGATDNMSGSREWFKSLNDSSTKEVCVANGKKLDVNGKGDVHFTLKSRGNTIDTTLKDVIFIPDLTVNLISVSTLAEKGFKFIFDNNGCDIIKNGKVVLHARKVGRIYRLQSVGSVNLTTSSTSKDMMLWHQRLGHLNFDSLASLRKVANDIDFQMTTQKQACDVCLKGKQTRAPFVTNHNKPVANSRLALIHSDVMGPMPTTSLGGKRYVLTFLDDFSRKVFVYPIAKKSDVCKYTIDFIRLVENQCSAKVKVLRTDNGSEYVNAGLENFLRQKGIVHQLTVPYSPQSNGSAERLNRSLMNKVRCLLYNANLDDKMWAEAVNTAAFLINRSPSSRLSGKLPEEVWSGHRVNLKNLRVFGCEAFAHVDDCKRKKLDPKSKRLIFLGYCENVKGYRLFNPDNNKVVISRDVVFNESVFPGRHSKIGQKRVFEPIYLTGGDDEEMLETTSVEAEPEYLSAESSDCPLEAEPVSTDPVVSPSHPVELECEREPSEDSVQPELAQESTGQRYNLRSRIPKTTCNITNVCNVTEPIEPRTVKEALSSEDKELWQKAMKDEIDSFILHGAWELTEKPVDKNVVKNKWIFTLKRDSDGNITRYKARLVAKGFTQRYGEDFHETFSPVVRHSSIRLLLSMAVNMNLKIDHLDVQTAFLNGDLQEEIFMQQPEGFICPGNENKVYRLRKAVYGLKQASRSWYQKVKDVLLTLGYRQCKQEDCIFTKRSGESIVFIALYVDDFFVFYNDKRLADTLKSSLLKVFKLKDLGPVRNMLGIKVERDATTIKLSQENRIDKLLDRFGMTDCKPVKSPMITNISSVNESCNNASINNVTRFPYQELIGSLMYLCVTTRPDISFAVSYLSKFNSCYTEFHWNQAKRILRYLKGTKGKALVFKMSNVDPILEGYSDADWAADPDRKSYTGYVFKYGGNSISWGSYKQSCISLSSTEAEYCSLSEASREAVFLQALIKELLMTTSCKIVMYCDNQSAIQLATNHTLHRRSKHIEIRYHYVRDMIDRFNVEIVYIPTDTMIADVFTKPLGCIKHEAFTRELDVA